MAAQGIRNHDSEETGDSSQGTQLMQEGEGGLPEQQQEQELLQQEAHRRMALQAARKALGHMPHFDGKTEQWRCFEDRWMLWMTMNLEEEVEQDFRKRALLYAMKGRAAERARLYKEGSTQWTTSTNITTYLTAMRNVFMPAEESEISRAEFKALRQKRNEDIASYLTMKISLWENAFPEAERSFHTLLSEVISGIYNNVVKRIVRRANPTNQADLRTVAITAVANERESYRGGYGESTSLDGLACVSVPHQPEDDCEPMEVDRVGKVEVQCFQCQKYGHIKRDCRNPPTTPSRNQPSNDARQPRRKIKCFRCDQLGHIAKHCRATLPANQGKRGNPNYQRVKAFGEEEEGKTEEGFLGEEEEGVSHMW